MVPTLALGPGRLPPSPPYLPKIPAPMLLCLQLVRASAVCMDNEKSPPRCYGVYVSMSLLEFLLFPLMSLLSPSPSHKLMALDADSKTLSPLPGVLTHGLVAVSTFGLLSFFCSTSLFFFLTYRLIKWRRTSSVKTPINQFLFLIYNLLLAGKSVQFGKVRFLIRNYRYPTSNRFPS
jgi:hypothetical protein